MSVVIPPGLGTGQLNASIGTFGSGGRDISSLPVPGGPARFSPNGSVFDVSITNASTVPITTFGAPITVTIRYSSADLAMANGDPSLLTVAYLIDANSPQIENPLGFPVGTWVFFPPSAVKIDPVGGTISVTTQALGSVVAVFANPPGYVQALASPTNLYSSFDPQTASQLDGKGQFSYLQVIEPQIGSRLFVLDPITQNYAYVNAVDVGPSGPPPPQPSPTAEPAPLAQPTATTQAAPTIQPSPQVQAVATEQPTPTLQPAPTAQVTVATEVTVAATVPAEPTAVATDAGAQATASESTPVTITEATQPTPGASPTAAASEGTRLATTGYTQTTLADGRILVSGGMVNGAPSSVAQVLNPVTGSWTQTGSMTSTRSNQTAALLSNGTVLVVGGNEGSRFLSSAEIYDPLSGSWSATSSMQFARINPTVRPMDDGRVLVSGGSGDSSAPAEAYTPGMGIWSIVA
jgi:hypothetical protein